MSTRPLKRGAFGKPKEASIVEAMGLTMPEERLSDSPWNFYRCSTCGSAWVTVDLAQGATPHRMLCKDRPIIDRMGRDKRLAIDCPGIMHSARYPDPANWPDSIAKVANAEWYYPPIQERKIIKKRNPRLLRYLHAGGMLQRPSATAYIFPTLIPAHAQNEARGPQDAGE